MKKTISIPVRPRRLRRTPAIRNLVAQTKLSPAQFVLPAFVTEGQDTKEAIPSMPGQFRQSPDRIVRLAGEAQELGVSAMALFPHIEDTKKDAYARESANADGLLQKTVQELKNKYPDFCVITDVAMDPYSSDGHDGVVTRDKRTSRVIIDNDATLEVLAEMALAQARAGADFVAPSDMMDGRIGYIRSHLDSEGFTDVGVISYAAKYASCFYGPFRDALDSSPQEGDKKTYQMDVRNQTEAVREVELDIAEGADMVMVKPALAYLDVIARVADHSHVPVAAYNVSGEFAMIKFAAAQGLIDEPSAVIEVLTSIARAGADIIFTYHALEAARFINDGRI